MLSVTAGSFVARGRILTPRWERYCSRGRHRLHDDSRCAACGRVGAAAVRRDELDYDLPPERIAQAPATPRDASRLLVLHRATGRLEHRVFRDVGDYLAPGDCLVVNDSRVLPARFFARRAAGGRVEGLFLSEQDGVWRVLLRPSRRIRPGEVLHCAAEACLRVVAPLGRGEWRVQPEPLAPPAALLARIGQTPLPPYIRRPEHPTADDAERYQTVYAQAPGSAAAPTAGLHFTPELLARLERSGVRRVAVTLHVGLGTFGAIDVEELAAHAMHAERFVAPKAALAAAADARRGGGAIVAVGTTSARVLESLPLTLGRDEVHAACEAETRLFVYPPYAFRNVDRLITNFHLPGSTLLALVMALGGVDAVRAAYAEAIRAGYRFYSYGDAMLIL